MSLTPEEIAAITKALAGAPTERIGMIIDLFGKAVGTEAEDNIEVPDRAAGILEDMMTALRAYWTTRIGLVEAERDQLQAHLNDAKLVAIRLSGENADLRKKISNAILALG